MNVSVAVTVRVLGDVFRATRMYVINVRMNLVMAVLDTLKKGAKRAVGAIRPEHGEKQKPHARNW